MRMIFSMSLTGALLMIFAISIGVATFIENDFGPESAQALVYKALWFEIMLGLLVANMIGVIFKQKLYKKKKWGSLLFHVAFIIILLGAAITRFTGLEGIMHIREGDTASSFLTDETYITGVVLVGDEKVEIDEKVLFVPVKRSKFNETVRIGGKKVKIKLLQHIVGAQEIVETNQVEGRPIITLVTTSSGGGRRNIYLKQGQVINLNNILIGFDSPRQTPVSLSLTEEGLKFKSAVPVQTFSMDTQVRGVIAADSLASAPFRHLLTVSGVNIVLSAYNPMGQIMLVPSPTGNRDRRLLDALIFEITEGDAREEIVVRGVRGDAGSPKFINVGDVNLRLAYGSKKVNIPFSVTLRDFQLDRYPGSESPSSYASEVTVKDEGGEFPFRIYMNNILSHKGYRLYQSSYDRDELGTVLSINKDKPGTIVSYIGYLLLSIGLTFILFNKNSRFTLLSDKIDKIHAKRAALAIGIIFLLLSPAAKSQHSQFEATVAQADSLSLLIYQTHDGRMAPIQTLASDVLRKVHQKATFKDLTPSQVFLGMIADPFRWRDEPIIQVKNGEIKEMIGISGKYASFNDFFMQGNYKLGKAVNAAYEKKPAERTQFDKDLMKVDERLNVSYMVYRGDLLKIFPVPNDPNNLWISPSDNHMHGLNPADSLFAASSFKHYIFYLIEGKADSAQFMLDGIKSYQRRFGADVIPSENRVNLEISFNELNLFERLYPYYLLTGLFLLIVNFIKIFRPKAKLKGLVWLGNGLIILGFIVHLGGLAMRWYISGHEPWSNGYESMIYIAWASVLAGLLFSRKSEMTLAVTAILAGVILFVAHLSWMDPEITNLVPVLKSYWLTIHVSIITSSYGFLAIGAILAFLNLLLIILRKDNKNKKSRISLTIGELSSVIESALIIGLFLLTIGTFLGGIWANESWGRYWGWDAKETWSMVSILVYSFIVHTRFIPGLKSIYAFNLLAFIGFSSILMTYFGVNFYLSGLHSYATGDPVPIPDFVYYTLMVTIVVATIAYFRQNPDEKTS